MIDVSTFVGLYNSKIKNKENITDEEKIDIVSSLIHPLKYISFEKKKEFIKSLIKQLVSKADDGEYKYSSADKYYSITTLLLDKYTDLSIDERSYDLLCMSGTLDYIIASFGREYEMCCGLLDMYIQDLELHRLELEDL